MRRIRTTKFGSGAVRSSAMSERLAVVTTGVRPAAAWVRMTPLKSMAPRRVSLARLKDVLLLDLT
jgi:hypothetical protein